LASGEIKNPKIIGITIKQIAHFTIIGQPKRGISNSKIKLKDHIAVVKAWNST
jgi:hypothetical protein